jgi:hypothetical protein
MTMSALSLVVLAVYVLSIGGHLLVMEHKPRPPAWADMFILLTLEVCVIVLLLVS